MSGTLRTLKRPKRRDTSHQNDPKTGTHSCHFGRDTNCGDQKVSDRCVPERVPPQTTGIAQYLLQNHVPGHFYALS